MSRRIAGVILLVAILFSVKLSYGDAREKENAPHNAKASTMEKQYPALPQGITSFGAAVAGDWLYVYGGHTGEAHSYSTAEQSNGFLRLNLKNPLKWETLASGPKLQGLGLVGYKGNVYRVGGFTARNKEGEDHDLHSSADFSVFDSKTMTWNKLPALPEGRSSHDAVVLGHHIYVVGGWKLVGESESYWHDTSWRFDLNDHKSQWQKIAVPKIKKRAFVLAANNGKIYLIGGITEEGKPTTAVDVYDAKTDRWSAGPNLAGGGMDGFGAGACTVNGKVFATTMSGTVQLLDASGTQWKTIQKLKHARFFHRMVSLDEKTMMLLGGTNPQAGKRKELDTVTWSD